MAKPFGTDLASAASLNAKLHQIVAIVRTNLFNVPLGVEAQGFCILR